MSENEQEFNTPIGAGAIVLSPKPRSVLSRIRDAIKEYGFIAGFITGAATATVVTTGIPDQDEKDKTAEAIRPKNQGMESLDLGTIAGRAGAITAVTHDDYSTAERIAARSIAEGKTDDEFRSYVEQRALIGALVASGIESGSDALALVHIAREQGLSTADAISHAQVAVKDGLLPEVFKHKLAAEQAMDHAADAFIERPNSAALKAAEAVSEEAQAFYHSVVDSHAGRVTQTRQSEVDSTPSR